MDYSTKRELEAISTELTSIINELDSIADGIRKDFKNIGNDKCAASIEKVASNYRTVRRKINNIDTTKYTDAYLEAHPELAN